MQADEKSNLTRQSLWNMTAASIDAVKAVLITMIVRRISGLEAAGMISFAFAVGVLLKTVGTWGTHNIHASDIREEYSFGDYLKARILNILIMLLLCAVYLIYASAAKGYTKEKVAIIGLITFMLALECFNDVIWGEFQRRGRLDIGAKLFVLICAGGQVIFFILLLVTKQMVLSLLVMEALVMAIYGIVIFKYVRPSIGDVHVSTRNWKGIIRATMPLFLVMFLMYFMNNIPKYSIDKFGNDIAQAYYGFIATPIFIIEVLSNMVYQPQIVGLSEKWNASDRPGFIKGVIRQIVIIIILMFIGICAMHLVGTAMLSGFFSVDLSMYKREIDLIMISSGMLALVSYADVLFAIIRRQKVLLYIHLVFTVVSVVLIPLSVEKKGITGAASGSAILLLGHAVASYLVLAICLNSKKETICN